MNAQTMVRLGSLALVLLLAACGRDPVSFSADVQPILTTHCIECHGGSGEGIETSGFSVVDYAGVMRGTQYGTVVVPGSSISSTLYLVVSQKTAPEIQMPPHHERSLAEGRGAPLSEEAVATIAAWIDEGAFDN